jgi:hypothetical protein
VKGICKNSPTPSKPNLRIISIEEEVQAKGIYNIINKIITENFPNPERDFAHSGTGSLQDSKQTRPK